MKKLRIILLLLLPLLLFAQKLKPEQEALKIKSSRAEYWWGEAYDLSKNVKKPAELQKLKDQALADLVNRIRVHVFSQMQHQETEADGKLSTETQSNIRLSSAQYLSNVHYLEYQQNKRSYVLVYLSRQDYQRIQEEQIQRIQSILRSAQMHETAGEPAFVEDYLRAYLLAQSLGQNLQHEGVELSSWIKNKITALMQNLPLKAKVSAKDAWGNYPIEISTTDTRLSGAFEYDLPELGFKNSRMADGSFKVFYEGNPSKSKQNIETIISPDLSAFGQDELLKEGAEALRMHLSRQLALDFTEHISVDWEYTCEGLNCRFSPEIKGLSIAKLSWDFGDESAQDVRDLGITHEYRQGSSYLVTLTVNDDLKVSKTISVKGKPALPKPSLPQIEQPQHEADRDIVPTTSEQTAGVPQDFAHKLQGFSDVQALTRWLDTEKEQGTLVWGWLKKQEEPEGYWLVILEPKTGEVIERLAPEAEGHRVLSDQSRIKGLGERFKGKLALYIYLIGEDR
ncbi:MAG: PKD domain-containing protein [Candidatus Cloacimonetes bacterium]|nr:PKD domain-containing protein [Candidatus Cloacimonadota bacterium]